MIIFPHITRDFIMRIIATIVVCTFTFTSIAWSCPNTDSVLAPIRRAERMQGNSKAPTSGNTNNVDKLTKDPSKKYTPFFRKGFKLFGFIFYITFTTGILLLTSYLIGPCLLFKHGPSANLLAYIMLTIVCWLGYLLVITGLEMSGADEEDTEIIDEAELKSEADHILTTIAGQANDIDDDFVKLGASKVRGFSILPPSDYETVLEGGKGCGLIFLTPKLFSPKQVLRYVIMRRILGYAYDVTMASNPFAFTDDSAITQGFWNLLGDYELLKRSFSYGYYFMTPYILLHTISYAHLSYFGSFVSNVVYLKAYFATLIHLIKTFVWNGVESARVEVASTNGIVFDNATDSNGNKGEDAQPVLLGTTTERNELTVHP